MSRDDGIIGVSDHGGWAVLVTVAGGGTFKPDFGLSGAVRQLDRIFPLVHVLLA